MSNISNRFAEIKHRIAQAAERSGRDPEQIKIVAVSKFVDVDQILEAQKAGITIFGENRVQEFIAKYAAIKGQVKWHFIGTLQSNKVKYIFDKVELIHSLDRYSLAEELSRYALKFGCRIKVLVQVNVSNETSKHGIKLEETISFLKQISSLDGLEICGLMTIAPLVSPEKVRPFFIRLREQYDQIAKLDLPHVKMQYLSMGMTNDYEVAVEEGANLVRIGTGIFGSRQY